MIRARLAVLMLAAASVSVQAAEPQTIPLTYSALAAPDMIFAGSGGIMSGANGTVPTPRTVARFGAPGESVEIELGEYKGKLTWAGEHRFTVTTGASAAPLRAAPKSYGFQPATLTLAGGRKYSLAFPVVRVAAANQQVNADAAAAMLWYRSASAQTGTVDEETVWFYDTNTDGSYTVGQDGVRVGPVSRTPVFAPLSRYFATSKGFYRIESLAEDGSSLSYSAYEGPTGQLQVKFASGVTEMNLVLIGSEMAAVATASSRPRPDVTLIPGRYRVQFGAVTSGGKVAALVNTQSLPAIEVSAEAPAELSLGAPYSLKFEVRRSGDKFAIHPNSFALSGKSEEQYSHFNWQSPPVISVASGTATRRHGVMAYG